MPATAKIVDPNKDARKLPDLTKPQPADSNGPDRDEFLFMAGQLCKADADLQEKKLARKKLRNHFKLRGVDLEQMDLAIAEKEREDNTTLDNLKTFARYCQFFELPIGHQFDFFASPKKNGKAGPSLTDQAFAEGRDLGIRGLNADEQKYPPMTPEGQAHLKGWNEGQDVLKAKFVALNDGMAAEERAKAEKKAKKAKSGDTTTGGEAVQ